MSDTHIDAGDEFAPVRRERVPRSDIFSRVLDIVMLVAGGLLLLAVATVPLAPREQAILAVVAFVVFLVANRFKQKQVSVFVVMLSLSVSLRYIVWRTTETLEFTSLLELLLGSLLILAELYAIWVLIMGFVQTLWPLERRPVPLPDDIALWPTVDVYIPTYNEPMSIVRATVLGCIAIDWPPDKVRVYILDDGRREEFRLFAQEVGVGYIGRTDNSHAKAGNLNHAMKQTDGEFICVFDSDHIPVRAFLQMTMGWLLRQPRLALVQTPHHFYSPDSFQRNLAAGTRVPSEGNMFYGLLQDGNDYWNATFFCGSCAVLRRSAVEEIGGFAVETVTEDAHTMLKLHRRGWDSAYLKLPLAAGLATERLVLHIGQRMRWARGMIQIFRIDNPFMGKGLSFGQRICYAQAMVHFLFAIPRAIFLVSPLCYLLFNLNIIAASPLAITAYALPHIVLSVAVNSRLQANWRHSFWSEIYETVLALFLIRVTLVTIWDPKRGKFNVTAKGGLLENGYFDLGAVYPNLIMAFLLIAGVMRGIVSMIFVQNELLTFQALLLNSIWAGVSLLIVMAALAVGRETRQVRSRARVRAVVPVTLYLPDGRTATGITRDLSQGGAGLVCERPNDVPDDADIHVEFTHGDELVSIPARIIRWEKRAMQISWQPQTLADEARVVQVVFGRADSWIDWANYPVDRPIASLWRVLVSIRGLFRRPDRAPVARPQRPAGGGGNRVVQPGAPIGPVAPVPARGPSVPAGAVVAARTAAGVLIALGLAAAPARGQEQGTPQGTTQPRPQSSGMTVRAMPGQVPVLQQVQARTGTRSGNLSGPAAPVTLEAQNRVAPATLSASSAVPLPSAGTASSSVPPPSPGPTGFEVQNRAPTPGSAGGVSASPGIGAAATPSPGQVPPLPGGSAIDLPRAVPPPPVQPAILPAPGLPGDAPRAATLASVPAPTLAPQPAAAQSRKVIFTLRQLGALGPLTLRGTSELQGVQFGIRSDEVVTAASLNLSGAMSPALIPEFSNVTVTLNEQYVGTIPATREPAKFDNLQMQVSPVFFQDNNRLNFRFTGRYTIECNDPLSGLLWGTVSDTSTMTLTLERLPPQRDLARLPLPFFDAHEKQMLVLPFVVSSAASMETLQAAGIVSSWFGQQADFRGANFPISPDAVPEGNAVLVAVGNERPGGITLPPVNGPMVAVVANPGDASRSVLVVAGRTGAEVIAAAQALTVGSRALGGEMAAVNPPTLPQRKAYDAPAWIPTDRPVKFGELVDASDLQGTGYVPGTLRVPFRTAPDLYTWRNRGFPMELSYRAPPGPIIDLAVSRLDVGINNLYLDSFPLADDPSKRGSWITRVLSLGSSQPMSKLDVPVYNVFGQNDLQFYFDTRPLHRGECVAVPNDLRMSVDPDSTIDLSRGKRFAELPNLAFFVNSGFPFTRMADLSETAVVLPARPTPVETQAYLNLMGRLGAITGMPVVGVKVVAVEQANTVSDRDLLLIGTMARLGNANDLLSKSPFQINNGKLDVKLGSSLDSVRRLFGDSSDEIRRRAQGTLQAATAESLAAVVGSESPLGRGHTLVALLASAPQALDGVVSAMRDSDRAPLIQGDLSIMSGAQVTSYRVGSTYSSGTLPIWLYPSYLLRDQPLGILVVMLVGAALMAFVFYWILNRRAIIRNRSTRAG